MSFDFSTLITDRSRADLDALRDMLSTPMSDWTAEQLAAFNLAASKGAYNFTDLNRVTDAMAYLDEVLKGYGYETGFQPIIIHEDPEPEKPILPDGYTELLYIESTGTQFVDTEIAPNQSTRVVVDLQISQGQTSQGHICSVAENVFYTLIFNPIDTQWYQSRYGNGNVLKFPASLNNRNRVQIDKNGRFTTIGETTLTENQYTFQCTETLPLFCRKSNGSKDMFLSATLYGCQIYNNGAIARDFVPCINPDGAVGLYDLVGSEFFGNSGTGVFLAGPQRGKLPAGYTQLQYIESQGAQYIDTEFTPNQDTRVLLSAVPLSAANAAAGTGFIPYGAAESYNSRAFECYSQTGQYEFNYNNQFISIGTVGVGSPVLIDHNKNNVTVDDGNQVYTASFPNGNFTSPYTLALFATRRPDGVLCGLMRILSCEIYNNGDLIRKFVPCQAPGGDIGLYDMANAKFYENSGSGVFIAGPVAPAPDPEPVLDLYTWYETDVPTIEQMTQYLSNVVNLCDVLTLEPGLPENMVNLTIDGANQIEEALSLLWQAIQQVVNGFARSNCFTFWSGSRPIPCP